MISITFIKKLFAPLIHGSLITALIVTTTPSAAKSNIVQGSWIRNIGAVTGFSNVEATADQGYIALSTGNTSLIKFGADGQIAWAKHLVIGSDSEEGLSIQPTPLGGYVGLVLTRDQDSVVQFSLIRFSEQGDIIWQRHLSTGRYNTLYSRGSQNLAVAQDGSIHLVLINNDTASLMRFDDTGTIVWQKSFAEAGSIGGGNVIVLSNGDLMLDILPPSGGERQLRLFRLNSNGQTLWQKQILLFGSSTHQMAQIGDNEIVILVSYSRILKIDGNGTVIWEKAYGETGELTSSHVQIKPDTGHSFIVIGNTTMPSPTNPSETEHDDLRIVRIDRDGNVIWYRRYGVSGLFNHQLGQAVAHGANDYYLALGSNGRDDRTGVAFRLDSNGTLPASCPWNTATQPISPVALGTTISPLSINASSANLTLFITPSIVANNQTIATEFICRQPDSNTPPIANAGPDQIVFLEGVPFGHEFQLNGIGSIDPDGDRLAYGWQQTGGNPIAMGNLSLASMTLIAPSTPQTLTFTLVVTDIFGLPSNPDTVTIQVREPFTNQLYLPTTVH